MEGSPLKGMRSTWAAPTWAGARWWTFRPWRGRGIPTAAAPATFGAAMSTVSFDKPECAAALVNCLLQAKGPGHRGRGLGGLQGQQYDKLADGMRAALDMEAIYRF